MSVRARIRGIAYPNAEGVAARKARCPAAAPVNLKRGRVVTVVNRTTCTGPVPVAAISRQGLELLPACVIDEVPGA